MNSKDIEKFNSFINPFSHSITSLLEGQNGGRGYPAQALILLYSMLDQLGWVYCETEFSEGKDFKKWIIDFCHLSNVGCNEDDLWIARCGSIHMGITYNKHFQNKKDSQLAFYLNKKFSEQEIRDEESRYLKPTKFIDMGLLLEAVNNGVGQFFDALLEDEVLAARVIRKIDKRQKLSFI
jgi:hypothetical protein